MSAILYYSNYCEHSKKLLQMLGKSKLQESIHFVCVDKRVKKGDKLYVILENGQEFLIPPNVNRMPALLLLKDYSVLYGEQILQALKPRQEVELKVATSNNMEPMAYSLGGGSVVSDSYSFLTEDPREMSAEGNGGTKQMHSYAPIGYSDNFIGINQNEFNTTIKGQQGGRKTDEYANQEMENRLKKMQEDREADLKKITGNRPPAF